MFFLQQLFPFLVVLLPIAIYCVALATLNRREQPALVHGSWDFLGLLFAASGLLLFVLPHLVFATFQKLLDDQLLGEKGPSPDAAQDVVMWWWVAWGVWWALILGGAALLVWSRRNKTVIYNIAPAEFERALEQALARLKLTGTRRGARILIAPARSLDVVLEPLQNAVTADPEVTVAAPAPTVRSVPPSGEAVVDVQMLPMLANVTLHWRDASPALRQEIELELARELREVRTYDNPAGSWFLGVAGFLFALLFLVVLVMILRDIFPSRR
ncbi:MAG TPA: hypothetical protein VEL76_43125 [Gemmataceae bacterium]|nr:hypothetical protein [Gemmataceae bacterium]